MASEAVVLEADRALLDAFRAGDHAALERIYRDFVDDVFRLVARVERHPAEQRARVQDVFVRAFADRARAAYDGIRPYRPYLLRLARNCVIDHARRQSAERAARVELDLDALSSEPEPIDPVQVQQRDRAAAYIATLDAEARELVRLRFTLELSQAATAEQLRVTRRRVRTVEARVIAGLRKFLKKDRPAG
jgi:RNA polymerase sigma-70 factor (ECF subfamily)